MQSNIPLVHGVGQSAEKDPNVLSPKHTVKGKLRDSQACVAWLTCSKDHAWAVPGLGPTSGPMYGPGPALGKVIFVC